MDFVLWAGLFVVCLVSFSLLSCSVSSELCIGCSAFLLNEIYVSVSKKKKKKNLVVATKKTNKEA